MTAKWKHLAMRAHIVTAGAILLITVANMALAGTSRRPSLPPPLPPLLSPRVPVIQWAACTGEVPTLQCGQALVPLNYNQPDGAQIALALARVPATRPDLKIGTLFINPGGPGGSGVDLLADGFSREMDANMRERFDIVSWDPRGVARSGALNCWPSIEAQQNYLNGAPTFPFRSDQESAFFTLRTRIHDLCVQQGQAILRHMSTADSARDLDLLRRAVGDRQLSYLGYSYGSYLGQTYANMYPTNFRAMVIDGVLDPVAYSAGRFIDHSKTGTQEVTQQFLAQCESAATRCPLNQGSGPSAHWNRVLGALHNGAVLTYAEPGGSATQYTYDTFMGLHVSVMYDPAAWQAHATRIAALSAQVSTGRSLRRPVPARPLSRPTGPLRRVPLPRWARYSDNYLDSFMGTHCADVDYPATLQAFSAMALDALNGSLEGQYWAWLTTACASWPSSDHRYQGPWHMPMAAPVLVVSSRYDASTPYAGAVAAHRLLPNSRLLVYAGWGHTTAYTGRSACVSNHVSHYLITRTLPPQGTVCASGGNPFLVTNKARSMHPLQRSVLRSGWSGPRAGVR